MVCFAGDEVLVSITTSFFFTGIAVVMASRPLVVLMFPLDVTSFLAVVPAGVGFKEEAVLVSMGT